MSLPGKENKLSVRFLLNRCRESDKGVFYLEVRAIYCPHKSKNSLGYTPHESNYNKIWKLGINVGNEILCSNLKVQRQGILKQNLAQKEITCIASLVDCFRLSQIRNLFMFSFYFWNMAFVDVAHLARYCFADGATSCNRNKRRQYLQVGMLSVLQEIIEKCRSDYPCVFSFSNPVAERSPCVQCSALGTINRVLKQLCEQLFLTPLTTDVMHCSWSIIAEKESFSMSPLVRGWEVS